MKKITLLGLFSALLIVVSTSAQTGMRGLTNVEVASEMAPGVNLWNSLDAYASWIPIPHGVEESQTCWGNPLTTPEMVQAIADRGFKTLRIPTTWYNHMVPGEDWVIDTAWMDRVEEVANYALDAGLYAVVNIHHEDYNESHEGTWLVPTYEKEEEVTRILEKIWLQIATRFKDYNDHLILETMNEPREVGSSNEWDGGSAEHRDVINKYNLAAVNAIRATGGNNAQRILMIPQVGANMAPALEDMIIPNGDTNIIVSVHAYSPFNFCLNDEGTDRWGTNNEIKELQNMIQKLSDHFVSKGQAVVMGEWGAGDKDNYADRVDYYDVYAQACKDGGITPIAWMYGFNRNALEWEQPLIEDAMLRPFNEKTIKVEDISMDTEEDILYVGESLQLEFSFEPIGAVSPTDHIWTSYNEDVVVIDELGMATAVGDGKATIRVSVVGAYTESVVIVKDTVTSVSDNPLKMDIQVFPNPVSDKLNVVFPGNSAQIELYGLDGQQLFFTESDDVEVQIDMNEFEKGTYILRVTSENESISKKIIVE